MKRTTTTVLAAALLLCVIAALVAFIIDYVDTKQRLALHDKLWHFAEYSTPIIAWLEAERERAGTYPSELPENFKAVLQQTQPPARYSTSQSNTVFRIGFGDYVEDDFEYYWNSHTAEWYWDG